MTKKDYDIFEKALAGVKPLKKSDRITKPIPKTEKNFNKKDVKKEKSKSEKKEIKKIEIQKKTSGLINLEKSYDKKLKKGKIPINKKIDLHGYSLNEARQIFLEAIDECYQNNARCILFITGKGLKQNANNNNFSKRLYHGKIRNNFLDWASSKGVGPKILSVQQADIKHGGDGAFFVYLRKNKT